MKTSIIKLTVVAGLLLSTAAFAQKQPLNKEMYAIAKSSSSPGWIDFDENANLNIATLFTENKTAFGLGQHDEMQLTKTTTDRLGYTHFSFQQYYRGYKVFGATFFVHQNASGKLVSANGTLAKVFRNQVEISVSETVAFESAKKASGIKSFLWDNAEAERKLKEKKGSNASYFPVSELVWVSNYSSGNDSENNYKLCFKFDILSNDDHKSSTLFIDAQNGEMVLQLPLTISCDATTNSTVFNGSQTISTRYDHADRWDLHDNCSGMAPVSVLNANLTSNQNNLTEIKSSYNYNEFTSQNGVAGAQLLFGLRNIERYFAVEHLRNSYNDSGATIEGHIRVEYGSPGALSGNNASWSPGLEVFNFGYGNSDNTNMDDYITLDIVGHEFTHAVTQYAAGLNYVGESGALNESFSDIFGEIFENYVTGTNDWLCAGQIGTIRNFMFPYLRSQPSAYNDSLWVATNCANPSASNDYCGVHTNSGVQNRMFYLLCMGGSGTNYFGYDYKVNGIGIQDASAIAYRALTVYLTSTSDYQDAREAWIRASNDLFGSCSNQSMQTGKAWAAVAVGMSLTGYDAQLCGTINPNANTNYVYTNTIVASPSSCGNTISASNYSVNYKAGEYIKLSKGFTALAGCHFSAQINPCMITNYKTVWSNSNMTSNNQITNERKAESKLQSVSASPNPFNDELNISFNLETGSEVIVQLFDLTGRQTNIAAYSDNFDQGSNSIRLNTSDLPNGMYLMQINCGNETKTIKVVK